MNAYGSYSPDLAFDFIAREEGCRLKAYRCSAGVLTIGYGHTAGVKEDDEISQEQADAWLREDIAETAHEFAHYVNVPISEGMYVALTSLAFNLGASNVPRKCPKLMRALNSKDYEAAAKEFLDVTGGGPGLVGRRKREYERFMEGL